MTEYTPQIWQYHLVTPKRGKKLILIKPEEVNILIPLVRKKAALYHESKYSQLFSAKFFDPHTPLTDKFLRLSKRCYDILLRKKRNEHYLPQLTALNEEINEYFSDDGWRYIRKEYQQILKRQSKSNIQINSDTHARLEEFKQAHQLGSIDETIDELLSLVRKNPLDE